jgi:triacylglycerol esterase/lipase EstA (alpha/beta hydrolase family)
MKRVFGILLVLICFMHCTNAPQKLNGKDQEGVMLSKNGTNSCMDSGLSLKYPLVLVHGIIAHDRGRVINFWGRIPKTLEEKGVKVFFGNTDSWGGYESNAEILRTTIEEILYETKSEKVNIIAHSKGGIDSRYLIWKYNYGDKVASLTTIATPHHGAEIADLIYTKKIVHSTIVKKTLRTFGKLYGDIHPDPFNVNYQLTTENMRTFNETVSMDDRVYYQSIYTTMKSPLDDIMFFNSYRYIKSVSGDNDGLVSECSAKWGNNSIKIGSGISHTEIIDYKKKKIAGINIPDIYIKIVKALSERGF